LLVAAGLAPDESGDGLRAAEQPSQTFEPEATV
jgi:hypothetical protein